MIEELDMCLYIITFMESQKEIRLREYRQQHNRLSPATHGIAGDIAGDSGCRWRHRWQYGMLLAIVLAIQGVAGNIAGDMVNCW